MFGFLNNLWEERNAKQKGIQDFKNT